MSDLDDSEYTATIIVAPSPQTIVCSDQTVSLGASVTLTPHSTDGNRDIIDVGTSLEANHQPKYTFGGGDNAIATIDPATGLVTTVGVGTTTFTIDSAATESYEAATPKEVKLTVNATAPGAGRSGKTNGLYAPAGYLRSADCHGTRGRRHYSEKLVFRRQGFCQNS